MSATLFFFVIGTILGFLLGFLLGLTIGFESSPIRDPGSDEPPEVIPGDPPPMRPIDVCKWK